MKYCGETYVEYIPYIPMYDIQSDLNPNPVTQNQTFKVIITIAEIHKILMREVYYCGDMIVGREV